MPEPGRGEIRQVLADLRKTGKKGVCLLGDIKKAHRRIKIRRRDWGFQACRLRPGRVWVNKVGTYGMNPAAYHWARFASATLVRLGHYLLGEELQVELLLFADDLFSLATTIPELVGIGFLIFVLTALGVPFGWKKFRGGSEEGWIGYHIDFDKKSAGISGERAR